MIEGGAFEMPEGVDVATGVMVSIEPSGDNDGEPSDTRILAGDVSQGTASLVVGDSAAIGNTFESANGFYILATPTDGHLRTNENSGIWFRRAVDQLTVTSQPAFLAIPPNSSRCTT